MENFSILGAMPVLSDNLEDFLKAVQDWLNNTPISTRRPTSPRTPPRINEAQNSVPFNFGRLQCKEGEAAKHQVELQKLGIRHYVSQDGALYVWHSCPLPCHWTALPANPWEHNASQEDAIKFMRTLESDQLKCMFLKSTNASRQYSLPVM